jgi:hexosaminidase
MTSTYADPPLLPAPTRLVPAPGVFDIDAATSITIGADASDDTLFAARLVQAAVRDATGLEVPLRKERTPGSGVNRIAMLLRGRDDASGFVSEGLESASAESYQLAIAPGHVWMVAPSEAGLFYAAQTLRQLLRTRGRRLPGLAIDDRPALPNRGLMLDISRGRVPTLETVYILVDTLAAYKYNQLQLYTEHTFQFPSHPLIGQAAGSLSADDILRLDQYCRARHVELVPNLQSFGHLRTMLSLPEYAHLDEVGWRWSIAPAHEETYQLFEQLYADLLPAFTSRRFNIDCDETWDLARGQSRGLAQQLGGTQWVYLRHILRLRELAGQHSRRIMLWADIVNEHPDVLPQLPEDVVLLDWHYESAEDYPTTAALGKSGREFWVCPGTSSWNTLFPRLDNALGNIRNFTRDGIANGARGMLLTDWGDYGHYQSPSVSWYPYIFGAATAWTGGRTDPDEFDRVFTPLFLGRPAGDASLTSLRRLGRAVVGPSLAERNGSNSAYALFEDPLGGKMVGTGDAAVLTELREAGLSVIADCATLADMDLRHDLQFAARQIEFAARKVLLGQHIRQVLRSMQSEADLDEVIDELAAMRQALPPLVAEFEARWLHQSRRSQIHLTLERFERTLQRFDAALAWLRDQRARYVRGEAVDAELASYDGGAGLVLWEEGRAEHARLRELIGAT